MSDPYIGEIRIWANTYNPIGWAYCNGAQLSQGNNPALFAIIGQHFGGSGINFLLPDLRNRAPIGIGQGAGLTPRIWANKYGETSVTLLGSQIPAHTHSLIADVETAKQVTPNNSLLYAMGVNPTTTKIVNTYKDCTKAAHFTAMSPQSLAFAGGSQAHDNMQPYLSISYCIAIEGVFPVNPN
jgi:microcystin-dependent protein